MSIGGPQSSLAWPSTSCSVNPSYLPHHNLWRYPLRGGVSFGAWPQDRTACAGWAVSWDGRAGLRAWRLGPSWRQRLGNVLGFTLRTKDHTGRRDRKWEVWTPCLYYTGFQTEWCQSQPTSPVPSLWSLQRQNLPLTSTLHSFSLYVFLNKLLLIPRSLRASTGSLACP